MTLTEQDKQKFATWLESKTAINFKCPICTGNNFAVLDEIVILTAIEGGRAYPNVGLICQCCKHTVLFNAIDSGVIDD